MNPTLGHIGPITLRTYTLLLDLALLVGLGTLAWNGWRLENRAVRWLDAGLSALALGLVASRAGHVAIHWNYFSLHREEIAQIWNGGLDWHAAVLGGLLGLGLYSFVAELPFRRLLDALAVPLALGAVLIWTGCLMASCAYGAEVRSLADYPTPIVMEWPDLYGIVAPRFASQYFGVALSAVLVLPAWRMGTWVRRVGVRLWAVLILLALSTFGIGYTRGDLVPITYGLRLDQLLDLGMAVLSLIGLAVMLLLPVEAASDEQPEEESLVLDEGATDAA
jgi:phosphatidylglycerol:prolipoprotein diacylglycerol transferase